MAVQKKKSIKSVTKGNIFTWTGPRKKAALLISEGMKNYEEIAEEVGVHRKTFWEWRQNPIFQDEVSRLTLANEKATKEGLLRLSYKAIEEKIGNLKDDKNTALDWAKFIADIQGHVKQKVELDANIKHDVNLNSLSDEELMEIIKNESKS
jgi:transposase-like protein